MYVGEDTAGRIVATSNATDSEIFRNNCCLENPHIDERKLHIAACGVYNDQFFDRKGYKTYTIDEIIPRVHDLFAHGIIRYDSLWFLSEGEQQLADALSDAKRLVAKYDRPFILGMNRDGVIIIAPLIRGAEFVAPFACVVGRGGAWRLSGIRSDMCGRSHSSRHSGVVNELYMAMGYREKEYGGFAANGQFVESLGCALEDAARMAAFYKEPFAVMLYGDVIRMRYVREGAKRGKRHHDSAVMVRPGEFMDNGVLSLDKISAAAYGAYDRFLPMYRDFV